MLSCSQSRLLVTAGRSRRKKHHEKQREKIGKKVKLGSHLDGPTATQCPRCDGGKQRRCLKLPHCTARHRSPPGTKKKKKGKSGARVLRPRTQCHQLTKIHACAAQDHHQ